MLLLRPLFLLAALLLAMPGHAVPALWTVSKGGASLTLYGTIHALPPGGDWFSPRARAAFSKADTLVVEMVPPAETGAMAATAQALGTLPAPVPIEQRLPADLLPKYRALAAKGIPTQMLDGMKSWFAALNLVQLEMLLAGIDPAAGVDVTLIRDARAARKTLRGLETPMGQLELFNSLPEAEQRLLLASAISEAGESATAMRALIAAWSAGDIARIRSEFDDSSLSPTLEMRLFRDRNAAWTRYVVRHLQGKGRIFMAVGAAHMAGPDSLIEMLKARGFKVRRVE